MFSRVIHCALYSGVILPDPLFLSRRMSFFIRASLNILFFPGHLWRVGTPIFLKDTLISVCFSNVLTHVFRHSHDISGNPSLFENKVRKAAPCSFDGRAAFALAKGGFGFVANICLPLRCPETISSGYFELMCLCRVRGRNLRGCESANSKTRLPTTTSWEDYFRRNQSVASHRLISYVTPRSHRTIRSMHRCPPQLRTDPRRFCARRPALVSLSSRASFYFLSDHRRRHRRQRARRCHVLVQHSVTGTATSFRGSLAFLTILFFPPP